MQGMERPDRQLLDAQALVGHLVAPGSMFAFLAAHRQDLFGDNEFEDLFPSGKGRPSIPASVMASILVLQTLHDLSDGNAPRRSGVTYGGRSRPGWRWTTRVSIHPRWCTGVNGWRSLIGRSGSTKRYAG